MQGMMKNTPGPRAPLFRRRPSLKMTALSYSWMMIVISEEEISQTRRQVFPMTDLLSRKVRPDILNRFTSVLCSPLFSIRKIPIIQFNWPGRPWSRSTVRGGRWGKWGRWISWWAYGRTSPDPPHKLRDQKRSEEIRPLETHLSFPGCGREPPGVCHRHHSYDSAL